MIMILGIKSAFFRPMEDFTNFKAGVLVTDGFEESELIVPVHALKKNGIKVHIISPKGTRVQAYRHLNPTIQVESDRILSEIQPGDYDAVLLPGGVINSDSLRIEPHAQEFIRAINDAGKPIAAICHGSWLLVSAGIVRGRVLTSWSTLADDIRNAGGTWRDQEVVVDGNFVTSRKPADLPAFCREMLTLFAKIGTTRRGIAA